MISELGTASIDSEILVIVASGRVISPVCSERSAIVTEAFRCVFEQPNTGSACVRYGRALQFAPQI